MAALTAAYSVKKICPSPRARTGAELVDKGDAPVQATPEADRALQVQRRHPDIPVPPAHGLQPCLRGEPNVRNLGLVRRGGDAACPLHPAADESPAPPLAHRPLAAGDRL